jgi:HPt (histidine-containing phosphotransfer) domain-containing protein
VKRESQGQAGGHMERVIAILREKNHLLEKFYWINEQEIINFGGGNFETVENFYQAREQLLALIGMLDQNIEELVAVVDQVTAGKKSEVAALLQSKDELVKAILDQDLQILTYIDKEKSNIIRELHTNKQAKKAVSAYASSERSHVINGDDL